MCWQETSALIQCSLLLVRDGLPDALQNLGDAEHLAGVLEPALERQRLAHADTQGNLTMAEALQAVALTRTGLPIDNDRNSHVAPSFLGDRHRVCLHQ